MKVMWKDKPENRPTFSKVNQEIQQVMSSSEMELSYSYTADERRVVPRQPPKELFKQRQISRDFPSYVDFKAND